MEEGEALHVWMDGIDRERVNEVGCTHSRAVTAQCVRSVALCNLTRVIKPRMDARWPTNRPCSRQRPAFRSNSWTGFSLCRTPLHGWSSNLVVRTTFSRYCADCTGFGCQNVFRSGWQCYCIAASTALHLATWLQIFSVCHTSTHIGLLLRVLVVLGLNATLKLIHPSSSSLSSSLTLITIAALPCLTRWAGHLIMRVCKHCCTVWH